MRVRRMYEVWVRACISVCACARGGVCVNVCMSAPANVLGDAEGVLGLVHELEPGLVEPLHAGTQVRVLVPHLRRAKVQQCACAGRCVRECLVKERESEREIGGNRR